MAAGDTLQKITPQDALIFDTNSNLVGIKNPRSVGNDLNVSSLVSGAGNPVISAAAAGQDSGWIPYVPGMRLAYALDSGSTTTTFSVDISADGSTSLGPALTGTSPPIWLTNTQARYIRFNVLSGGPLSVIRF